jgi:hypothetical protein
MTGHFTWCGACGRSHSLPGGKLDVAASSSRERTILRLLPTRGKGGRHPATAASSAATGATWSDAVVIFPGEVLAFQNTERQAHALRAPAPAKGKDRRLTLGLAVAVLSRRLPGQDHFAGRNPGCWPFSDENGPLANAKGATYVD